MSNSRLGWAWIMLSAALIFHVTDEAVNGFLSVYNPTVAAVRARLPWVPFPVFRLDVWLAGLVSAIMLMLGVTRYAFRDAVWMRPIARILAVLMIANGIGHVLGTIAGSTVASVRFERPMPGFWSSPVLIASSIYLLLQLKQRQSRIR